MKRIQEAVRTYLQSETGIKTVSDRTRVRGEYPLLAVSVQEAGTILIGGGRQAEHTYQVAVSALHDRERAENMTLLSSLTTPLLRGIPLDLEGERRILHPLNIRTEEETLIFSLELCVPVPPAETAVPPATDRMNILHFEI